MALLFEYLRSGAQIDVIARNFSVSYTRDKTVGGTFSE